MDAFNVLSAAKKLKSHINYTKPSKLLADDPRILAIKKKIKTATYGDTDGLEWLKSIRKYDKNYTGKINLDDFVQAVRTGKGPGAEQIPYSELKAIFFRIDTEGTGKLGYDTEFAEFMQIDLDEEMEQWIQGRKTEKELTSARAANKATYTAGLVTQIKRKLKANAYIAGKLDMERLHKFYDRDKTGTMEFYEFKRAVRRDGKVTEEQASDAVIKKIFRQMDVNDSGTIPFAEEFLPWLTAGDDYKPPHLDSPEHTSYFHIKRKEQQEEAELDMFEHARRMARAHCYRVGNLSYEKFFQKWDKDGEGNIDFEEFRLVLRRDAKISKFDLPDDKLEKLFQNIERDGDGTIELKEFIAWLEDTTRYNPPKYRGDHGRGEKLMTEKLKKEANIRKAKIEEMRETIRKQFVSAGYSSGEFSLQKAFKLYDRDHSGDVTFDEFKRVIRKEAKVTVDQFNDQLIYKIFRLLDRDGSGTIQIEEFGKWLHNEERPAARSAARSKTPPKIKRTALYREGRDGVRQPTSLNIPGANRSRPTTPIRERPVQKSSARSDSEDSRLGVFDAHLDTLMGLVRVQTEEVARMRKDHAEDLAQLRAEYDALVACLDSSGVIAMDTINTELEQQLKNNQSLSDNISQHQPTYTRNGMSNIPPPRLAPRDVMDVAVSPASGSTPILKDSIDLYELTRPLLQPNPKKMVIERAFAKIERALDDPNVSPNEWRGTGTPLHAAEKVGDVALAHLLLDKLADVNILDEGGISVLHQACYDGRTEMVKLLLDRLADPNQADRHEQTPMFFAPSRQVCEALYAAHADINTINSKGQSSLHLAARAGLADVLSWQSKHVPRSLIDMRDLEGFTAVEYAEQAGISSVHLNRLRVWEPRLVTRKESLKRGEIDESDMERRRRLWEIAHREQVRREQYVLPHRTSDLEEEEEEEEEEDEEAKNEAALKLSVEDSERNARDVDDKNATLKLPLEGAGTDAETENQATLKLPPAN